jgi:hypothetical protein
VSGDRAVAAELVRDGVPLSVIAIHGFGDTNLLIPPGQAFVSRRADGLKSSSDESRSVIQGLCRRMSPP